jgi:hypothetical protein
MNVARYADLAARVLEQPPALGNVRMVAVDGPAGSGKTTFAARLADAVGTLGASVAVIHTDDLLDGWADMVAFWPRLEEWVLAPLARGEPGRIRRYDWDRGCFAPEWHEVAVPSVLIVEGVTSARTAMRGRLSLSIFVTAERDLRLARGLARDGEALRADWLRWMEGEEGHFAADRTPDRADVRVDGAPATPHDPYQAFVRLP